MTIRLNNNLPIIDLNTNSNKTIFISSFGRSGSTFLTQILNFRGNRRVLFEPLKEFPGWSFNFESWQPVNQQASIPISAIDLFSKMMTGKLTSRWIDRENSSGIYYNRIVKTVRSNILLPWATNSFPEVTYLLLLRDPVNVYHSWQRLGWENGFQLRKALSQNKFSSILPEKLLSNFLDERNEFLTFIYGWSIYNYIPLHLIKDKKFLVLRYEDLINRDKRVLSQIRSFCGIDLSRIADSKFFRSSSTSSRHKDYKNISTVRHNIPADLANKVDGIMESTGLDKYYNIQ